MSKEVALSWIDENEKRIIEISDRAWEYAEVGLLEHRTSKLFSDWIEKQGFQVERGLADMPTAFVATWSSGDGPTIGLMGELDALAHELEVGKADLGVDGSCHMGSHYRLSICENVLSR